MISYILYILMAVILLGLVVYFFFTKALYSFFQQAIRKRGGLKLKSAQVGDDRWPYLEGGNADGPPVVLLHGFGGDKDNWSIYAPYITKQYRLIAPDLPGFGENTRSPDRDYSIAEQAKRVNAFLEALALDQCHLGGNSMGGYIALQYALDFPDKIASLTLFNNAGVIGADKSPLQIEAENGQNALALDSLADIDRLLSFVAYKPVALPKQFRKLFFEEANAHKDLLDKIFWQIADSGMNNPLNDRLGEVKAPTLIIWGRHDQLIDVSCVDVLNDGIPETETAVLEETGHVPMIEKPKQTATKQLAFLAKR